MRRWLSVVTLGLLLVGMSPTAANAARPSTIEYDFTAIDCPLDITGHVFFYYTTAFGPYMEVSLDDTFGFTDDPADVSVTDGSVTATVELFDPEGQSVGDAALESTFTTIGDPQPFDERYRDGNVRYHDTGFAQGLEVTGTLTALGTVFDLTGCIGSVGHVRSTATSPDAFVSVSHGFRTLNCFFETADGFVFLSAFADRHGTFADIDTSSGFGFDETAVFTATAFHASFELLDPETGVPTGETATADATLTASTPQTSINGHAKRVARDLAVEGTLFVPGMGEFDMSSCEAEYVLHEQFLRTTPHVRPPANDVPDDAIAIAPGETVQVRTGGAAPLGEAGTSCLNGEPPGYSVWYTLVGTGGQVTLDPAGSDFDTVIAVYTREGDTFTEVSCIDDDDDLAGALTFDTDAGVTYWVQVGGFFADFGTLVLTAT